MARWLIDHLNCFTEKPALAPPPPPPQELGAALLEEGDDNTSARVIGALRAYPAFVNFSAAEGAAIASRDEEDGEKLQEGITLAVEKGVLPADLKRAPYKQIDVLGKSADEVADVILTSLGSAARTGCVVILVGLSGTGKGTTVAKLKGRLPNAMTWSNGNIFRALTLLAVRYCEICGFDEFDPTVLQPKNLATWIKMLEFGRFAPAEATEAVAAAEASGDAAAVKVAADAAATAAKKAPFDIRIKGYGLDVLVDQVKNTLLKEQKVSKHIPTVAKVTQGEVVKFAAGAVSQMGDAGITVLLEGREQTVDFIPSPHRFCLTMSDPALVGMRRAAQRLAADAFGRMSAAATAAGKETPYGLDEAATLSALRDSLAALSGEEVSLPEPAAPPAAPKQ